MQRLHSTRYAALALALFLTAGCVSEGENSGGQTSEAGATADTATAALARPDSAAVAARVESARARLDSTEAGRMVHAAIEAHGGLARWYGNGPLHFRYAYERLFGEPPLTTAQTVDPWQARAVHAMMPDSSVRFGWTGEEAWVQPAGAEPPINPRFWSLTPYYFVGMPFVLADPGVNLERAGQMTAEEETYDLVRVTFDAGTGDAPDDYYYLLVDPETQQAGGVRYVVSYPGFYPEGGSSPERLMLYDGAQTVDGVTLQEGFRSFLWTEEGAGEPQAEGRVTDVRFLPALPDSAFAMPAGAAAQDSL